MDTRTWWWLSRASGIVATVLLVASVVWGILLATRMLRPIDRPAWLLSLHRWFSALTCIGVVVHLVALVADNYVHFAWKEIFLPGGSSWKTMPVALGVVAMYLLAAVQVTSLLMKRIPKRWWRTIHLLSYAVLWLGVVHGVLAGTDANNRAFRIAAWAITAAATMAAMLRALVGSTRARRAARA